MKKTLISIIVLVCILSAFGCDKKLKDSTEVTGTEKIQETTKTENTEESTKEVTEKEPDKETEAENTATNEPYLNPIYIFNHDVFKEIEQNDTCLLEITEKSIQKDVISSNGDENDALTLLMTNNGTQKITQFEIAVVGYAEAVTVPGTDVITKISEGKSGSVFTKKMILDIKRPRENVIDYALFSNVEKIELSPGQQEYYNFACNTELFDDCYIIVGVYTTEDGQEHINPLFEEWYNHTYVIKPDETK